MNATYPIFLTLEGCHCIVAGLGPVGARKLAGLLRHGVGSVLALDIRTAAELDSEAQKLLADPRVTFANRRFEAGDLPALLVFAATGDFSENRKIAEVCKAAGVPCNCITDPAAGTFILPALATCDMLQIALSTGGECPFLAREWRKDLETWAEKRVPAAWLGGKLREIVLALPLNGKDRADYLAAIASGPLAQLAKEENDWSCIAQLHKILPESTHPELNYLLTEFYNVFS